MDCKNCGTSLTGNDKFCNVCGAKVINKRITMGHLATEMKEGVFSIDSNKPIRTFSHLFTKPEEVIDGYINGVRKKYIHAFGYFTIAILLTTFFYFIAQNFFPESLDASFSLVSPGQGQQEAATRMQKKVFEYQSILFYVSIPIMAFISFVVFFNKKKYNYAEHLVFNLYAYSQISIVAILLFFATIWHKTLFSYVQLSSLLIQIGIYSFITIRLFKLSFKQYLIKLLMFAGILFIVYIAVIIVVIVLLVATGNGEVLQSMAIPPPQ